MIDRSEGARGNAGASCARETALSAAMRRPVLSLAMAVLLAVGAVTVGLAAGCSGGSPPRTDIREAGSAWGRPLTGRIVEMSNASTDCVLVASENEIVAFGTNGSERWRYSHPSARVVDVWSDAAASTTVVSLETTSPPGRTVVGLVKGVPAWSRKTTDAALGLVGRVSSDGLYALIVSLPVGNAPNGTVHLELVTARDGITLWEWEAANVLTAYFASTSDLSRIAVSIVKGGDSGAAPTGRVVGLEHGVDVFMTDVEPGTIPAFTGSDTLLMGCESTIRAYEWGTIDATSDPLWSSTVEHVSEMTPVGADVLVTTISSEEAAGTSTFTTTCVVLSASGVTRGALSLSGHAPYAVILAPGGDDFMAFPYSGPDNDCVAGTISTGDRRRLPDGLTAGAFVGRSAIVGDAAGRLWSLGL